MLKTSQAELRAVAIRESFDLIHACPIQMSQFVDNLFRVTPLEPSPQPQWLSQPELQASRSQRMTFDECSCLIIVVATILTEAFDGDVC